MANLIISEQDAARLRDIAQQENRPVEEIVSRMINDYAKHTEPTVSDNSEINYRKKLYAEARAYWQKTNNRERLAMTDAQLDEQFWCFDTEGIPRLKSDQGRVTVPEDGLLTMLEEVWQDNPTGEVEDQINYREILNKDLPEYLMRRIQESNADSNPD